MFYYKIYGLRIASEIMINQATPGEPSNLVDVTIRRGKVPKTIDSPLKTREKELYMVSDDEFLFHVKGVATFYIRNGQEIIVCDISEQADHVVSQVEAINLFLCGTCLGAALIQRNTFPLHGSCVEKNGKGIVLVGDSGAGKSTVARAFINRGWRLVSDDVIAVTKKNNSFFAESGFPGQKLWDDALERTTSGTVRKILRTVDNKSKFAVDLKRDEEFCEDTVKIEGVFILIPEEMEQAQVVLLEGITPVHALMNYVFRKELISSYRKKQKLFSNYMAFAENSLVFEVLRPVAVGKENELAKEIRDSLVKIE